jgi:hypothetical protein
VGVEPAGTAEVVDNSFGGSYSMVVPMSSRQFLVLGIRCMEQKQVVCPLQIPSRKLMRRVTGQRVTAPIGQRDLPILLVPNEIKQLSSLLLVSCNLDLFQALCGILRVVQDSFS